MNSPNDTIAAICTAPGEGSIAIIRISGPESIRVADHIFRCRPPLPSERKTPAVVYGHIIAEGLILDEALLLVMHAPHSYTREDVVEFQCHGGNTAAKRILKAILNNQVRLAEPGEFTRRAFLNGRIDLLQAEAVLDIIKAQTDRSAMMALEQLEGSLSASINDIYDILLKSGADLEATLDFPDDELPESVTPGIMQQLSMALVKMNAVLHTWDEGHLLRNGARVVISGQPNVGKSTLLNALLGKDRVIVSPIPGTTRDTIEEQMIINGIPIRLVDTAGLRTSECALEKEGVRRAKKQIEQADINLYVVDASQKMGTDDRNNITALDPRKTIIIMNKIDLGFELTDNNFAGYQRLKSQAVNNQGIAEIKYKIIEKLGISDFNLHKYTISERHRRIMLDSKSDLLEAISIIDKNDESAFVCAASKLKSATDLIGQIIGRIYYKEMLDSIFSRFCIGK